MDPITLSAILAGVGALGDGLSAIGENRRQNKINNELEQLLLELGAPRDEIDQLLTSAANADQYMQVGDITQDVYSPNAGATSDAISKLNALIDGDGGAGSYSADTVSSTYDPDKALDAFLGEASEFQDVLSAVNDSAYGNIETANTNLDTLNRQSQSQIMNQVESAFGGNPLSGAYASAVGQGIANPLIQQALAREQLQAQAKAQQAQLKAGLVSQALGQAEQGRQFGANMDLQAQRANQSAGMQAQGLQQADLASQRGLQGSAAASLASLAAPQYFQQQYAENRNALTNQDRLNMLLSDYAYAQQLQMGQAMAQPGDWMSVLGAFLGGAGDAGSGILPALLGGGNTGGATSAQPYTSSSGMRG